MKAPIRAVAGLLCVGEDILLVRRNDGAPAFPGYWSCPGGKVEADEAPPPPRASYCGMPTEDIAALRRELLEELGWDMHQADCRLSLLGRAITPPNQARRFDTAFFRINLDAKPELQLDRREHSTMQWASASTFWQRYLDGDLLSVSPLQRLLEALNADPQATEVPLLGIRPGEEFGLLLVEPLHGLRIIPLRSHTLPPATHTNAFLLGDEGESRILVDPSPTDRAERERLEELLNLLGWPEALFLTHHHPDHHEQAPNIARNHGLPIYMSADTHSRLLQRWGAAYLEGVEVREVQEGDSLCRWKGQDVRAIAVPGHDAGQLALMPDGRGWMIVGDLYQGVGTVVIGQPEGNMGEYFSSLRKVIELAPAITVPSHGIALPGTLQIQRTLEHREQREARILQLHRQGLDVEAMLAQEYAQVPKALWPLARMNIEGHLQKLADEGQITKF